MSKPRTLDPQQSTSRTAVPATQRLQPFAYRVDDAAAVMGVSDGNVLAAYPGRLRHDNVRIDADLIHLHEVI